MNLPPSGCTDRRANTILPPDVPGCGSGSLWVPLDLSAGVESDPNNYGSVVGDATGLVTFTAAVALTADCRGVIGATTTRPCAIDIPAPDDWDPTTEDLWLRLEPLGIDLGSNKRLGIGAGIIEGTTAIGCAIYESSSGNGGATVCTQTSTAALGSVGATLPAQIDLHPHWLDPSGGYRVPALGFYETAGGAAAYIGAAAGSTGWGSTSGDYTLRAFLLHGLSGTAVAGGEQVSARVYYARFPRPRSS